MEESLKKMLLLGSFLLAIGNVKSRNLNEVYNKDTNQYVNVPGSWTDSCYPDGDVTYIRDNHFHSKCFTGQISTIGMIVNHDVYANTKIPYVPGQSYSNCKGTLTQGECPNKKN